MSKAVVLINEDVPFGVVNFLGRRQKSVWDGSHQVELIYAKVAEAITIIHFSHVVGTETKGER